MGLGESFVGETAHSLTALRWQMDHQPAKSGSRHISDKLQSETICRPRGGGGLATAEYYRNRAANVRLEAGRVQLPHLRVQFIRIAEQYEELAAMIEQDQKKQPSA